MASLVLRIKSNKKQLILKCQPHLLNKRFKIKINNNSNNNNNNCLFNKIKTNYSKLKQLKSSFLLLILKVPANPTKTSP